MNAYERSQERARARAAHGIAALAAEYAALSLDELRAKLRGASPWGRAAIRRLMSERGIDLHVEEARQRDEREVYAARYAEARRNGFPAADARLHAEQAVELHRKERDAR